MEERLTEDLLQTLLASDDVETFLDKEDIQTRTFTEYLWQLLDEKGIERPEVIRKSGINGTVVYKYFNGIGKRPGRDMGIKLAFGLSCDVRETQRLLRSLGVAELWPKQRRDAIILWCIKEGLTREECDDELYRLGEKTLVPSGGDGDK